LPVSAEFGTEMLQVTCSVNCINFSDVLRDRSWEAPVRNRASGIMEILQSNQEDNSGTGELTI